MGAETKTAVDARGVPIEVGAAVIYGAPVGRSIALVEGVVDGFTDSGRVWVRVTRRAYGSWASKERVHVGPDRIAQVTALPDSPLPTQREERIRTIEAHVERTRTRIAELEGSAEPRPWEGLDDYRAYLERYERELAALKAVAA